MASMKLMYFESYSLIAACRLALRSVAKALAQGKHVFALHARKIE
jgi:hypothetical protein